MENNKITVNIPAWFSARVDDYHEFEDLEYKLNYYLGLKFEYEEVGCSGKYEAIFYTGKKPQAIINEAKKTYIEN